MPEWRVKTIDESEIDTVLADDVEFEGELEFDTNVLIKGAFSGRITSSGDLFINESAKVDAAIRARRITVRGSLSGELAALERVELFDTAAVAGSIETPDLIVQSGCRFNGSCSMSQEKQGAAHGSSAAKRPDAGEGA